jgi:hypothetical protein
MEVKINVFQYMGKRTTINYTQISRPQLFLLEGALHVTDNKWGKNWHKPEPELAMHKNQ